MEKRKIKVYKTFNNDYKNRIYSEIPEIKLKGQWLLNHGFTTGSTIVLYCSENQIIIKKET
ncbi:SymE family type I addiction module toxin [Lachnotalea glycerini]|uniref:Type I addiction module toxin, SymE family n=1 Tax=Lachnotalea glycerini TaxID=1763509 RepID=A0A371J1P1_9FIRM|nr:SymE family type I addiction module toxin [Lachnotalea glycerini]RDY26576.1 type I addiction module toxin, SymE family [Lachnotalea glycerini]